jgi:hypothetical protein
VTFALLKGLPLSVQLIGVDGGATHVRAREVEVERVAGAARLVAGSRSSRTAHRTVPGFETPAQRGLDDPDVLEPPTPAEREQGWAWIESTARCVLEVARSRASKTVLLGVAMPGVKTADGRGIAFALHGPRVENFLGHLGEHLASEGVELAAPIAGLYGDGWCCGLGERHGQSGLLKGLRTAYYVGGGTGVAEALVLDGEQVRLESVEDWFPRVWRLRRGKEPLEGWLSASGINRSWARISGFELPLEPGRFPEERMRDRRAAELFELAGEALGHLIAHRIVSLATGCPPEQGSANPHVLERVVVGQRLGRMLDDPRTSGRMRAALESELDRVLRRTGLDALIPPDGGIGQERRELVRTSRLEEAAALGAAACALQEWSARV